MPGRDAGLDRELQLAEPERLPSRLEPLPERRLAVTDTHRATVAEDARRFDYLPGKG
jgi:hypothetical protein